MPEWEIHPCETIGDNSLETQADQIEQEIESCLRKLEYLLSEKVRMQKERENASS